VTADEYGARVAQIVRDTAAERRLERLTAVFVPAGNAEIEKAFNQQGEESTVVRADGRPGRRATKWFSYDLPVEATTDLALVVTYNTDNRRPRAFDILVDGTRIDEVRLPQSSISRFIDVHYALPRGLVQNKTTIVVRFQAAAGSEIAPVFGLRIIRPGP
jgi:hypothetical protein